MRNFNISKPYTDKEIKKQHNQIEKLKKRVLTTNRILFWMENGLLTACVLLLVGSLVAATLNLFFMALVIVFILLCLIVLRDSNLNKGAVTLSSSKSFWSICGRSSFHVGATEAFVEATNAQKLDLIEIGNKNRAIAAYYKAVVASGREITDSEYYLMKDNLIKLENLMEAEELRQEIEEKQQALFDSI